MRKTRSAFHPLWLLLGLSLPVLSLLGFPEKVGGQKPELPNVEPFYPAIRRVKRADLEKRIRTRVDARMPDLIRGFWKYGWGGLVKVEVDENGKVSNAVLLIGRDYAADALLEAARKWEFQPMLVGEKAQSFTSAILVQYDVKGPATETIDYALKCLADAPDSPVALMNVAYMYSVNGKNREALSYAERAIEKEPENPFFLAFLASIRDGLKDWEKAVSLFQQAEKRFPESWFLIDCDPPLWPLGKIEMARENLLRALRMSRSVEGRRISLIRLQFVFDHFGEKRLGGEAQFRAASLKAEIDAVNSSNNSYAAYEMVYAATLFEKSGNPERAFEAWEACMNIDPLGYHGLFARLEVSSALLKKEEKEKSGQVLSRGIDLVNEELRQATPGNRLLLSRIFYWRGCFQHELGNLKSALIDFQKAVSLDSTWGSPYLRLGLIYQQIGDENAAQKAYRKYDKYKPAPTIFIGEGK